MILLIDNYDSFSYNLYQLIGGLNPDIRVIRNDEMTVADIVVLHPSHIVISPGPGRPADAGICEKLIAALAAQIPILGVCLGHQAICEVFGATVSYAKTLMHGKSSMIKVDTGSPLFAGMNETIQGARYHSLAARDNTIPADLKIIAAADDGEVMAVQHRKYPVYGVQFHPESILTPEGKQILINFLGVHND
ncbi:anthranilate synthase component II [Treponema primitia]|uniref:anthranilate synthase component II n=1 Tax=Treponema primitia TaxID=88058 RepID=UPI0002555683|nr:aminodeoxychorismate/anthranilate synthase component II [Treponema primitia]